MNQPPRRALKAGTAGLVACLLATGAPLGAQQATTAATTDELIKQQQLRKLELENSNAEAAQKLAPLDQLPLGDGKSSVAQGGGGLEAALLSAEAARVVATEVVRKVKEALSREPSPKQNGSGAIVVLDGPNAGKEPSVHGTTPSRSVIVLAGSEQAGTDVLVTFLARADGLNRVLSDPPDCRLSAASVREILRDKGPRETDFRLMSQGIGAPAAASLAIGLATRLFQNSSTLSGIEVARDDQLIAAAVVSALTSVSPSVKVYRPSARISGPLDLSASTSSEVAKAFLRIEARRAELRSCLEGLGPSGAANADAIKRVKALEDAATAFIASATTPGSAGRVELVEATQQEALKHAIDEGARILRVRTSYAGGSSLAIRNITTIFGAAGLKVSGGLVAHWSLSDPRAGTVLGEEVVMAACGLRKVSAVHEAKDAICKIFPLQGSSRS